MAYRAGIPLLYAGAIQYHPTGAAYPPQIYGALVTEKVRSLDAMLVNKNGDAFLHPLETRDVVAAAIIASARNGTMASMPCMARRSGSIRLWSI